MFSIETFNDFNVVCLLYTYMAVVLIPKNRCKFQSLITEQNIFFFKTSYASNCDNIYLYYDMNYECIAYKMLYIFVVLYFGRRHFFCFYFLAKQNVHRFSNELEESRLLFVAVDKTIYYRRD